MKDSKSKRLRISAFAASLLCGMLIFSQTAFALIPYTTYTVASYGEDMNSPHAMRPEGQYDGLALNVGSMRGATVLFAAENGNIYVADTANNRILIFDNNLKLLKSISQFVDPSLEVPELVGTPNDPSVLSMSAPEGVFVNSEGHIYVSDTGNKRILEFAPDFSLVRIIPEPVSEILPEDFSYQPSSLVVDSAGRLYVLVKNVNRGIVQMTANGQFMGFFGAQKVRTNPLSAFVEFFQSEEQRAKRVRTIPRQYNNIAIDEMNFVWLTTDAFSQWDLYYATLQQNRTSDFATVRRINPNGDDVLVRSGYYPPNGDVGFMPPSSIIDVTFKPNGIFSILDRERNKIFTYDHYGNLLYAMGGTGAQIGTFSSVVSFAYSGDDLFVLDGEQGAITKFVPTEYGILLEQALTAEQNREYEESYVLWKQVMDNNNNLDLAYLGIARVMLRQGNYEEAMEYYRISNDTSGYSKAYKEYRKAVINDYIILIPIAVVLVVYLITRWNKYTAKYNKKTYNQLAKYGLKEELIYAFHVIFHPFDGFWDLKHEKRGSFRAANIIVGGVIITFLYKAIGTGYIFNPWGAYSVDVVQQVMNVLIPLLLWCSSSWALTTLMSGEGSLKDIYITTSYALLPVIFINIPVTFMSNFMVLEELQFMNFFVNLSYIWAVALIIIGNMVIQDYTFFKNLMTTAFSVVCMGVELFLALLLIMLTTNIWGFFVGIYEEVAHRL